jgi:hypothetical protein
MRLRVLSLVLSLGLMGCSSSDGGAGGRGGDAGFEAGGAGGAGGRDGGAEAGTGGVHGGHGQDAADPDAGGIIKQDAEEEEDSAPVPPATAEAIAIAGQLHGAFLRLDCVSEEIELQYCLPELRGKKRVPLRFGGQPGRRYQVTLRVWGVMEAINYQGGTQDGKHFYIGGQVATPMTAEYGLEVGSERYYFNHRDIGAGDHYTYGFTYVTTIPITLTGGAAMALYVSDPDNFINTNHMESAVNDVTPGLQEKLDVILAQPLQGQFIYLEVATATAAP